MFSIVSITTPHFSTLFALLESPIAPTSLDKGQHPSATPPVGGAFPKEIDPSTPHSALLDTSANLADRADTVNGYKHGSTV